MCLANLYYNLSFDAQIFLLTKWFFLTRYLQHEIFYLIINTLPGQWLLSPMGTKAKWGMDWKPHLSFSFKINYLFVNINLFIFKIYKYNTVERIWGRDSSRWCIEKFCFAIPNCEVKKFLNSVKNLIIRNSSYNRHHIEIRLGEKHPWSFHKVYLWGLCYMYIKFIKWIT